MWKTYELKKMDVCIQQTESSAVKICTKLLIFLNEFQMLDFDVTCF